VPEVGSTHKSGRAVHRHAPAHALEVIDGPAHTGGRGDRQKVQHGIGGAAGGHDHSDGVFQGFFGHDVAWFDVFFDGLDQDAS
jgi:hypothetical protein